MNRLVFLSVACMLACGQGQLSAQNSTTRVYSEPDGAQFYVDGQLFTTATVFSWPAGSKHTITIDPVQIGIVTGARFTFGGWVDSTGLLNSNAPILVITANPALTFIKAVETKEFALTLDFFNCPVQTTPCNSPGTVYVNTQPFSSNTVQYFAADSTVNLVASPNPGFVFLGWNSSFGTANQGFVLSFPLHTPMVISPRFAQGKQVTLATNPPNLQVLADRAPITTPTTLDWALGSQHTLGAPASQLDINGKLWILSSWSFGAGDQGAQYTVGNSVSPPETVTGTFVPGARASFVTVPSGLKLLVDGRDNWPGYNFIWPLGAKHTVSAPADQVDSLGRHWVFKGWSNGGAATQDVTMNQSAADNGFRIIGTFERLGQVILTSSPVPVVMQVDGVSCPTPCTLDRPSGSSVKVSTPQTLATSDSSRLGLAGWTDGVASDRVVTVNTDVQNFAAVYKSFYKLTLGANPVEGLDLRADPGSTDGFYAADTVVSVTATPKPGYKFRRWTGDIDSGFPNAFLSISAPRFLVATADKVPYIAPTGIRNAAGITPDNVVAPGSLITIYGANLANTYVVGPASPLAQSIGGTTVRVSDRVLPLIFVAPEQINALLPSDLAEGNYLLTVHTEGTIQDENSSFTIARNAPGLFAQAVDDKQYIVATHQDGSAITPDSPAKRGETITVLGTGFGPYDNNPPDGFAVPGDKVYNLADTLEIYAGATRIATVWGGAAPGMTGTTAFRFSIGDSLPPAASAEIHVQLNGRSSNTVLLPVQ